MPAEPAKTPEHEAIYLRIRDLILFGEVEPGQPVTIQGLKDRVQAGMTPVREAIRRLCAEGALEATANRRVWVPPMTASKLDQIYAARLAIEPMLAEWAAKRAETGLVADLKTIDGHLDAAIASGSIRGYLEFNFKFHFRLYAAARAPVLNRIAGSLWLQVAPSLRVMAGRAGTRNLPDMHGEAVAALAAGRPGDMARLIAEDIRQGMDQVRPLVAP